MKLIYRLKSGLGVTWKRYISVVAKQAKKCKKYYLPVRTQPTNKKRKPNIGKIIWQLAATTTPATISPPSIFSTWRRDIGAGHFSLLLELPVSNGSWLGLNQKKFWFYKSDLKWTENNFIIDRKRLALSN